MSKYGYMRMPVLGGDDEKEVSVKHEIGSMGHFKQHWIHYVSGITILLFLLYEILNHYNVYGNSKHIYRYFGFLYLFLLITYTFGLDSAKHSTSTTKTEYNVLLIIFILLVVSTLGMLSSII